MTSTTDIERDLDDLSDAVLGELAPDERARLSVQLRAAGEGDRLHQLRDAAPVKTYEATDLDFIEREHQLRAEALYALWELDTGVWRFFYEKAHGQIREANYREFPDAEWTEEPSPENDFHEQGAKRRAGLFLADYRAWKRYATEDVGVSLREFLLHPLEAPGRHHIDRIEFAAELADGRAFDDESDGWAMEMESPDGSGTLVDDLAEQKYEGIASAASEGL
jgi:hypothetical protein